MKLFILTFIASITLSLTLSAQSTVKLFNPTAITPSNSSVLLTSSPYPGTFRTAQVALSCPSGHRPKSTVSGPFGGNFVVDNMMVLDTTAVCGRGASCFTSLYSDPGYSAGLPVELVYGSVNPVDVSGQMTGSGIYTFYLLDFGYEYGNTEIDLTSDCLITGVNVPTQSDFGPTPSPTPPSDSVICHRDNGNKGAQTLTVGPSAIAAHLAHGDSPGACSN